MILQLKPYATDIANELDLDPNEENSQMEIEGEKAMRITENKIAPGSAFHVPQQSKGVAEDESHRTLTLLDEEGHAQDSGAMLELHSGHYQLDDDGTHINRIFD